MKIDQYKKDGGYPVHVDTHDLILVMPFMGDVDMISHGEKTRIPQNQYMLIPAGIEHGFESPYGPVRVLMIEIE